jgi:hypothetical protein
MADENEAALEPDQTPSIDPNQKPPGIRPRGIKPKANPVGPGNEPAAPISVAQATLPNEATVAMVFQKEVVLTDDQHKRIRFPIGLVNVPAHLADHWFLAANGVRKAGEEQAQDPE